MKKLILAGMVALAATSASAREINGKDLGDYLYHGVEYLSSIVGCTATLTAIGCNNVPFLSDKDQRNTLWYKLEIAQLKKHTEVGREVYCKSQGYNLACRDMGNTGK